MSTDCDSPSAESLVGWLLEHQELQIDSLSDVDGKSDVADAEGLSDFEFMLADLEDFDGSLDEPVAVSFVQIHLIFFKNRKLLDSERSSMEKLQILTVYLYKIHRFWISIPTKSYRSMPWIQWPFLTRMQRAAVLFKYSNQGSWSAYKPCMHFCSSQVMLVLKLFLLLTGIGTATDFQDQNGFCW